MNKIYDKLLLIIAVLFLAGGVFLYLQKSGQVPAANALTNVEAVDNPYQAEAVPATESQEASWPEPVAQSAGPEWVYDVFTPPEIYIDRDGNFVPTGWKPTPPPPPFGIYLSEIVRKPYRIQIEGYIEEDRSDPSKTLLLMFDEEVQKQVRLRPGDENPDSQFKLLSFDIQRSRDDDNNIEVIAQAIILDQRSGEEVRLTDGERLYDSGVTVVIRSDEDADFVQELSEAPSTFSGPSAQYTLQEINLEASTITVEKQATEDEESEVRTLEVRPSAASESSNSRPAQDIESEESQVFDFMF